MQGIERSDGERTRLKFVGQSGTDGFAEVGFEPIGSLFKLSNDDWIELELPLSAVGRMELFIWPDGLQVWVPYGEDYRVFDSTGTVIDRL